MKSISEVQLYVLVTGSPARQARDVARMVVEGGADAIQLREKDRYDPAMRMFVAHLPLLAKRDFAQLAKLCGVDAA